MKQNTFNVLSWSSFVLLAALVTLAWGTHINWSVANEYQIFPLLGLVAWVVMALHYYLGTVRILTPSLRRTPYFRRTTGYIVLASIVLHPALLAYAQNKNGQGVPPDSFVSFVGEGLRLAVSLGTIALIIFLSFEIFERLKNRPLIQKRWLWISVSQCIAMVLIWIHALQLGGVLEQDWMRLIWFNLGFLLLPCFYVILKADIEQSRK